MTRLRFLGLLLLLPVWAPTADAQTITPTANPCRAAIVREGANGIGPAIEYDRMGDDRVQTLTLLFRDARTGALIPAGSPGYALPKSALTRWQEADGTLTHCYWGRWPWADVPEELRVVNKLVYTVRPTPPGDTSGPESAWALDSFSFTTGPPLPPPLTAPSAPRVWGWPSSRF